MSEERPAMVADFITGFDVMAGRLPGLFDLTGRPLSVLVRIFIIKETPSLAPALLSAARGITQRPNRRKAPPVRWTGWSECLLVAVLKVLHSNPV
eukprot:5747703-Amphidinium_carterae.1